MDKLNMERAGIAISQLEKVTETGYAFPENFLAYYELGNIYAALDKLELAQKYYLKLKEADEDFFVRGKALLNLAKIYQTQKKYDEAIEIFELLISDYDNYYQDMAYFFMGMVYEAKNETDKAISSYKMVRKDTSYQFEAEKNIEVLNRLQNLETESAK
jgi:tetratricopeptide (TPR) repeat protein